LPEVDDGSDGLALRAVFLVVRARARLRISVDDVAAAAFRLRWDELPNTLDAALRTMGVAVLPEPLRRLSFALE
jgi:hypothetical protein